MRNKIIAGIGAVTIGVLGYALFNKNDIAKIQNTGSSSIQINNYAGNIISATTTSSQNSGRSSTTTLSQNSLNEITRQNIEARGGGSGGSTSLSFTTQMKSTTLINKKEAGLYFDGAENARDLDPTSPDIPGFLSASYSPLSAQSSDLNDKACLLIMANINANAVKINNMQVVEKQAFILNFLRYVPNFGGLSFAIQNDIIQSIISDLALTKKIDATYYCNSIAKSEANNVYKQCLIVLDDIITHKITSPAGILQRLLTIPGFQYLFQDDKTKIVNLIIDGLNNGNLSREDICSTITSYIVGALERMALYQKCLLIIEKLSEVPQPITKDMILSYLNQIPGFTLLMPDQVNQIVSDIQSDPRIGGKLDAERHCINIVTQILQALEKSEIYQQCLKVMDGLIASGTKNPSEVATAIRTIPGFDILSSTVQDQLIGTVQVAINQGTLANEKEEVCRNIALTILDAISNSEIYKQCIKTLEAIFNSTGTKTVDSVLQQLRAGITGFQALTLDKQTEYANKVLAITDISQIPAICVSMTIDIVDAIDGSEVYKQCLLILNAIIADPNNGALNVTDIITKLSTLRGFSLIPKDLQSSLAGRVLTSIQNGTLQADKETLCRDIAAAILDQIGNGSFMQVCMKVVTTILQDQRRSDTSFISSQMIAGLVNFGNLDPAVQQKYVNLIYNVPQGADYTASAYDICQSLRNEINDLSNLTECAKTIMLMIIAGNDRAYILGRLEVLSWFKSLLPSTRGDMATQISQITIGKDASGNFVSTDYAAAVSKSITICSNAANGDNSSGNDTSTAANPNNTPNTGTGTSSIEDIPQTSDYTKCQILNDKVYQKYLVYLKSLRLQTTTETTGEYTTYLSSIINSYTSNINDTGFNDSVDFDFYMPDNLTQQIEGGLVTDFKTIFKGTSLEKLLYAIMPDTTQETTPPAQNIGNSLYLKFLQSTPGGVNNTLPTLLTPQAGVTFVSRMYRDRDLFFRAQTQVLGTLINDYIVELGKCTRLKIDDQKWQTISQIMKDSFNKVVTPGQNMNANTDPTALLSLIKGSIYYKGGLSSPIGKTPQSYTGCLPAFTQIANDYISGAIPDQATLITVSLSQRLFSTDVLQNYDKLNDSLVTSLKNYTATQFDACKTRPLNADGLLLATCDQIAQETCYKISFHLMSADEGNPDFVPLSAISGCSPLLTESVPGTGTMGTMEFYQFNPISQGIIGDIGLRLMSGFEVFAKQQRLRIVQSVWSQTASKYDSDTKSGLPTGPITETQCQQIMHDVWNNYSDDNLQQSMSGPFDQVMSDLNNVFNSLENNNTMKDYTLPPSAKCKCYIQKMYAHLDAKVINNFASCRGDGQNSQYSTFLQIKVNQYLTSRQGSMNVVSANAPTSQTKNLCVITMQGIQDILQDTNEMQKFQVDEQINETVLNQICVQQLRDVYAIIVQLKSQYFTPEEEGIYNGTDDCTTFADN